MVAVHSTLIYRLDRQVAGKCGDYGVADTPWAACLVAEEGGGCPHNFKKLDDDWTGCATYGSRKKKRVCCLLGLYFKLFNFVVI